MFQLVTLAGGAPVPVLAADGKPFVFETGKEAAEAARKLTAERGEKVQPRPMEDTSWRDREAARFADGTYQPVPFADEEWFVGSEAARDHFLHVSTERPDMVAFTEDAAKGAADRQTRLKVGVYLMRFFSDVLSSEQVRDIATSFTQERETKTLMFATTADDIERVYTTGPSSCMKYKAEHFASPFHPVRVYAAGDLAVAYMERDGAITARALVWPEKKRYGRLYGDWVRLSRLLDEAGYKEGSLEGARMLRVEHRGSFVVPYVDHALAARDNGDFLIIDEDGGVCCEVQNGLSELAGEECPRCETRHHEDDFEQVAVLNYRGRLSYESWCSDCRSEHTFTCESTDELWSDEYAVHMENGETWSQPAFERNGFTCAGNGGNYPDDEMVVMSDGEAWSREHFEEHGFTCPDCGENFANDAADLESEDEPLCSSCAEARREWREVVKPTEPRERPRKPGEFRVGDRVVVKSGYGPNGGVEIGILVHPPVFREWAVEFPDGGNGHACGGSVPSGKGWWLLSNHFVLAPTNT